MSIRVVTEGIGGFTQANGVFVEYVPGRRERLYDRSLDSKVDRFLGLFDNWSVLEYSNMLLTFCEDCNVPIHEQLAYDLRVDGVRYWAGIVLGDNLGEAAFVVPKSPRYYAFEEKLPLGAEQPTTQILTRGSLDLNDVAFWLRRLHSEGRGRVAALQPPQRIHVPSDEIVKPWVPDVVDWRYSSPPKPWTPGS